MKRRRRASPCGSDLTCTAINNDQLPSAYQTHTCDPVISGREARTCVAASRSFRGSSEVAETLTMSEISADMTGRAGDGTHQMSRESRARQAAKAAFRTTAKGRTGRSCCRPRRLRAFAQPARGTFSDPGTSASSSQKPNQPRALLGRPGPWALGSPAHSP